jgi:antirestriction protein ArdC
MKVNTMQNTTTQTEPTKTYFSRDLYQEVTDTIIQQLEKGTLPWHAPWIGGSCGNVLGLPKNVSTSKKYQGINIILLWTASIENGFFSTEWGTFKQWSEKEEFIRKGEKGSTIVYYDTFEKEVDGEIKNIPFLKSSVVFNRCQLSSFKQKEYVYDPLLPLLIESVDLVEDFVANTQAVIEYGANGACYSRVTDTIHMPAMEQFISTDRTTATEAYYSTLLHELTHWSGSPTRMNRVKGKKFGDDKYAFEELVAEFGAAFLCADFNITSSSHADHADYIDGWLSVLKRNKHFLVTAASEASKAVGYLQGLQPN